MVFREKSITFGSNALTSWHGQIPEYPVRGSDIPIFA
jgi:hypothetical protein